MATLIYKIHACVPTKLLQSCSTLYDPMDCSLPGSSVHGILWARILEWVVIPFSRESSWFRNGTCLFLSPALTGRFFTPGSDRKECLQCRRPRFHPCVGKIPWRREWLPTPVFLPGEFHGQRSLGAPAHGVTKNSTGQSDTFTFFNTSVTWGVTQLCLTLCDPIDYSLPGSSIHGIFHAKILEWVAISFSRRSSQPRDWIQVSHIVVRRFTVWATGEVP